MKLPAGRLAGMLQQLRPSLSAESRRRETVTPMSTAASSDPTAALARYGLRRDPFTGDAATFYADTNLRQRLDLLQYLIQSGDQLLLVKGAAGSGKSALLHQFLRRTGEGLVVCLVRAAPGLSPVEILVSMARAFGEPVTGSDRGILTENLSDRLLTLQKGGSMPLLVVDDAHLLCADAVALLLQLYESVGEVGRLLRVALFAEPTIDGLLEGSARHLKYRQDARALEMAPFSERQTAEYLLHRLRAAGLEGDSPFGEAQLRAIHKESGGLPGRINELAARQLFGTADGGAKGARAPEGMTMLKKLAWWKIALGGALLLAVAALLLFQERINSLVEGGAQAPEPAPRAEAPPPAPQGPVEREEGTLPAPPADPHAPPAGALPSQIVREGGGPIAPPVAVPPLPAAADDGRIVRVPEMKEGPAPWETPAGANGAPPPPGAAPPPPPPGANGAGMRPAGPATALPPRPANGQAAAPLPPQLPAMAPAAAANGMVAGAPGAAVPAPMPPQPPVPPAGAAPAAPTPPTGQPAAAPLAAAPAAPPGPRGVEWLRAQNPKRYTLQLFGSAKEAEAQEFVAKHGLTEAAALFRAKVKGKDWYAVVYGDYAGAAEARAAAGKLPIKAGEYTPWERSFASIHNDLKAAGE